MKKYLLLIPAVVVLVAILLLPRIEKGDVSAVTIDYGESQFFTDREQKIAAEVLMEAFEKEFPDYTLRDIRYFNDLRLLEELADSQLEGRILIYYTDMIPKSGKEDSVPTQINYKWYLEFSDTGTCTLLSHGQ